MRWTWLAGFTATFAIGCGPVPPPRPAIVPAEAGGSAPPSGVNKPEPAERPARRYAPLDPAVVKAYQDRGGRYGSFVPNNAGVLRADQLADTRFVAGPPQGEALPGFLSYAGAPYGTSKPWPTSVASPNPSAWLPGSSALPRR